MKNLLGSLSCLVLLFFGGNLFANSHNFSLGDVLKPMGAGGLGVPYSGYLAGKIGFDASWTGQVLDYPIFKFFSNLNCTLILNNGTVPNPTVQINPGFHPVANTTYWIDGAELYTMAVSADVNNNGSDQSNVHSIEINYGSSDGGGISSAQGGTGQCPCYQVTYSSSHSAFEGDNTQAGIAYGPDSPQQCSS